MTQPNQPSKQTPKAVAAKGTIGVDENGFDPVSLDAKVGEAVKWANSGTQVHSVDFDPGPAGYVPPPNSGDISPGAEYSYTFTVPGEYAFHDGKGPTSKGKVVVTA